MLDCDPDGKYIYRDPEFHLQEWEDPDGDYVSLDPPDIQYLFIEYLYEEESYE